MAKKKNDRVKVAGYAKRVFYNDNIEYRNFSPDLVGYQLTSEGGTPLFTGGNFYIDANLDPKPNVVFQQGTQSPYYTLNDVVSNSEELVIAQNIKTTLNLDITNPLSFIWYGSATELIRASLEEIETNWPAAIYVDNKVGSVVGNNITNYLYDITEDTSTFTLNSRYFTNPYGIAYTADAAFTGTSKDNATLRNFTLNYKSYDIEHNGISKKILNVTPAIQTTNSTLEIKVEGNPFPELTGLIISQFNVLNTPLTGSIPFFIKPNEVQIETFFTSLNDLQTNLLNRNSYPIYTSIIIAPQITDQGVIVTTKQVLTFPVLDDGYNLNFFDSYYLSYLDKISKVGENYDENNTDLIIRKYTAEVISSFDTVPRGDGNNLVLDGEKATKLLRIYGVSFDEVKKYINGIKFAHVVTYNKKDNVPDALVKDLAKMLGLDPITFVTTTQLSKTVIPTQGLGSFSGASASMSEGEVDTELYRRLILNIAWLWKSKGSRKAIEFLFRFIGAPEALVNFDEYIVIVEKPLDMDKIKELLLFYTGTVDTTHIPYDDDGFPIPPTNGELVIIDFIEGLESGTTITGNQLPGIVENPYTQMYFQKAGGWYKETFGPNAGVTNLNGNNPHVGPYDGGNEYLNYFSKCYVPGFSAQTEFSVSESVNKINAFINYNYGIFNGIGEDTTIFTQEVTYNINDMTYTNIDDCLEVNYSIIETPIQNDGKTTLEAERDRTQLAYNNFLVLIKDKPYLRYSPEFIRVKNEYMVAASNYAAEIRTENCNINQTLEICLLQKPEEEIDDPPPIDCCEGIEVEENKGYLQLIDAATGLPYGGNNYACCCESHEIDGLQARYIKYVEKGQVIQYCGVVSPCVGSPEEVREDGVVIFKMVGNTMPNNIFVVEDSCYQLCDDGGACYQYNDSSYCQQVTGADVTTHPEEVASWAQTNKNTDNFNKCFTRTTCKNTTIVSKPECCAWHGYDSHIVTEITEEGNTLTYVVCVDPNKEGGSLIRLPSPIEAITNEIHQQTGELVVMKRELAQTNLPSNEQAKANLAVIQKQEEIHNLNNQLNMEQFQQQLGVQPTLEEGYNKYTPYSNRNAPLQEIAKISTSGDLVKTMGVVKPDSNSAAKVINSDFYSPFDDPDINDPSKWEVESVDNYGRVSFSTEDNNGNKVVVDWNTPQEAGGDLYNVIGQQRGYTFDTFKVNPHTNQLTLLPPEETMGKLPYNSNNYATTTAMVVKEMVACEDVKNVTILFGSENDLGFELPAGDCQCEIDVTFDYMLKYDAHNIIDCSHQYIGCEGAIINDNSYDCIDCANFITFTNNHEDSILLEQNFNDKEELTEELEIWQSVEQLEPTEECCNAAGGVILPKDYNIGDIWWNTNHYWNQSILTDYQNLENGNNPQFISSFTTDMYQYQTTYSKLKGGLTSIINQQCIHYSHLVDVPCCDVFPSDYITTNNVCALPLKIECGIYSHLLNNYNTLLHNYHQIKFDLELCISSGKAYGKLVDETNELLLDEQTNQTRIEDEGKNITETTQREIEDLNVLIDNIDRDINQKNQEIATINTSISETPVTIDCTIYQQSIDQLNTVNVTSFCRKQNEGRATKSVENYNTAFNECVKSKTEEIQKDIRTYTSLLDNCIKSNELNLQLEEAKEQNNQAKIDLYSAEIIDTENKINDLTNGPNGVINNNEELQSSALQQNDNVHTINTAATILGKTPAEITNDSGGIVLTDREKTTLKIQGTRQQSSVNKLNRQKEELVAQRQEKLIQQDTVAKQIDEELTQSQEDQSIYEQQKRQYQSHQGDDNSCCQNTLNSVNTSIGQITHIIGLLENITTTCYNDWYSIIQGNLQALNTSTGGNYINYIDDIKLKFKLFVDNNGVTNLPYTAPVNPMWEWDSSQQYSGVYFEGSEYDVTTVETGILQSIIASGEDPSPDLFKPNWSTLTFNLPECVCEDLRTLYPNRRFKFGIEIENYECAVCVLVDNIQVNITDCELQNKLSFTNCYIPQLNCVIDNKKSWVYNTQGLETVTVYPNGECNTESTNNYDVTKLITPENRLWKELEYRYTEYENPHSDLILNTKSATFSIDPAKAIECDVYYFWKNIDCDDCPTSCVSGETVDLSAGVYSGDTLIDYTLPLSGTPTGSLTFSCETLTTILEEQVTELKNDYYILTSEYTESLSASYEDLLNKGGSLSGFYIEENNCGSDNLIIGNNKELEDLYSVIIEEPEGTISLWDNYVYSGITPYTGGRIEEITEGISAQTFNQTTGIDEECCKTLKHLITSQGVSGLGIDKNYQWNSDLNACTWLEINNCEGDCEYSGVKNLQQTIPGGECYTATTDITIVVTGTSTGYTAGYCIAPLSLTPAEDGCELVETTGATLETTQFTAYTGNKETDYAAFGAKWYSIDLNTSDLPYKIVGSSYILQDDSGTPVPTLSTSTNDLWDSNGTTTKGRLNHCSIWATPGAPAANPPYNDWIGFSYCLDISEGGTYCIGIGADNNSRFYLDGELLFTSAGMTNNGNYDLTIWKVFEITLTSGEHIIAMEGKNDGSEAGFGAELYDATAAELTAMTGTTELDPVILFSTKDYRSDVVPGNYLFDFGEVGGSPIGYTCPPDYVYASGGGGCYAVPTCVKVTSAPLSYDITATTTSTTVTVTGTTTICEDICVVTGTTNVCINPLDYLDVDPSTIEIKDVFDDLILRNLIDAKTRQVISGYPMLQLFYLLYLNASNCGAHLTGRLTYNSLFEFMDKIGDYWLDLLEQVVPATTIWEGCDNSGKIYRNTIFDQNKYVYRKYVLNFNDSNDCPLSGITDSSIGSAHVDIQVTQQMLSPNTPEIDRILAEIKSLEKQIYNINKILDTLNTRLCACDHLDPDPNDDQDFGNRRECRDQAIKEIGQQTQALNNITSDLNLKLEELKTKQEEASNNEGTFANVISNCQTISNTLTTAQQDLQDQYIVGTLAYEKQRSYIAGLKNEYERCVRRYNTQLSYYDTAFITSIYNSNEYEGTVTVIGDPEWEQGNAAQAPGPFYNSELIHDCVV